MPMARRRASEGNAVDKSDAAKVISDRKLLIISRIMAIPVVAFAIFLAIVKPEPGILLVLAFDVVFAGWRCPADSGHLLVQGQYTGSAGIHYCRLCSSSVSVLHDS